MAHEPPQACPLRGDETQLYKTHSAALRAAVRRFVNADDAVIEDACSFAWLQLMRHQPDRGPTLFAWLRTVAVREAWRLYQRDAREPSIEQFPGLDPGRDALAEQTAARDALRVLAALPPRQRDTLALLILGFSYDEIAALRRVTKTNVNRHLTRARRHLRLVRDEH
ncbi:MAG TPA: sigma-70 family RNA polymerase sigma factor [Baekduia sp.]|uniref:RNA polymerase sigma factor n=1 Tax=Baekduia sp. TaxID=2600305 RepID=UPI002D77D9D3|nr:sigma-70 family RNA polymerase sigma factor [Baekduia sp.]HET6507385.1 sigma-70 family RNA polymerase sigma factor [Baekduia sp.]